MKKLIFATHNPHKVKEIQNLISGRFKILSLNDINFHDEISEDRLTIEANALKKAYHIHRIYAMDCFADDTSLEVLALQGQPGVYSARFAELTNEVNSNENISDANIRKLLKLMQNVNNRSARFRTIIALIYGSQEYLFEGIVEGTILHKKRGLSGFGYDPVFQPSGQKLTFAEMSLEQKNSISHRAIAVNKLVEFLKSCA